MANTNGKSIIRQVVAIGIGAAIFVALTTVQIPIGFIPNTALQVRAAVLAFFAAVFGPVAGFAIGLIGHALGDALFYGSVWWSWVFPDAIFGLVVGIFAKKYAVEEGGFAVKQCVLFNVVQLVSNAVAWILAAPVLDILIYKEPANKVFVQGVTACICNVVIVAVLGSLLTFGYSKIKTKSSSLKEEE
ncbi:MAG: ECF-type riboflavin transporter substrate-binding protein [Treponema sp.]|nr:ECF-type riboflavin transporter substrate-binding protein [Treponema sp.]